MLSINIDNIGDLAVVECEGRIVRSEAAFKLRDAVISQNHRIHVLDLSEVYAIEGGGLGMLAFLQRWACDHDSFQAVQSLKSVRQRLEHVSSMLEFDIATLDETLLAVPTGQYALAG